MSRSGAFGFDARGGGIGAKELFCRCGSWTRAPAALAAGWKTLLSSLARRFCSPGKPGADG
jgi:hypothetical protein